MRPDREAGVAKAGAGRTGLAAVVARLASDLPRRELDAGFEEEGVPCVVERGEGAALALARDAAKLSSLGVGIGADSTTLVLVLAAAPARAYLEAPLADARAFSQAAARVAARRPLALVDALPLAQPDPASSPASSSS
jgi:hypothetical protein